MFILTINVTLIEVIILQLVAIILGVTVYFFLQSRKSLKQTIDQSTQMFSRKPQTVELNEPVSRQKTVHHKKTEDKEKELSALKEQLRMLKQRTVPEPVKEKVPQPISERSYLRNEEPVRKEDHSKEELTDSLKATIAQQQRLLNGFLKQVEEIENEGKEEMAHEMEELNSRIKKLEATIEKKDSELEELKAQAATAERLEDKIEQVYKEFEELQNKMTTLEKQAVRANNLALELEETRQSYEQIHADLSRKQDKLEDVMAQNQRMREELDTLEDKLAEANLQRQQLHKKVQFLQDLNADMQSMSDTNKKLQTELRRIGELESMLTMIAEERDYLLRKKSDK